jgi:hypothetical protein
MAHAILAILLASAIAATLVGRRANNAVSQGRCLVIRIRSGAGGKKSKDLPSSCQNAIDHRPLGYGERYWGEGATFGAYPRVVNRSHWQRPRLIQRVLFWGRRLAPSRARRAAAAHRRVAHSALAFGRREWISRTCGTCRAYRDMVWPDTWRVNLTELRPRWLDIGSAPLAV